ncbi:uncharacterized protein LODBEIA_P59310 [Lodderomyces beijingensis]|uniref:Transcription factor TFIIIC triple barrel domain-containing protein n=1 Tax=Lodderomyces beijingensis TaxID=1775926 RepID=A0ABP0ZVQ9_9ASCO
MTLEKVYIARHGYRSNWLPPPHPPNPTGIDSDPPNPTGIDSDPPLAPHGVEQAKQLAAYIYSLPRSDQPQFILTSPFYRCVETAQPIARMLNLRVGLERGVGEWFKPGRGVVPTPADYSDLGQFFPEVLMEEDAWPRDHLGVIPSLEGETPERILQRARAFWHAFIPQFEAQFPRVENILIVTHAATKIALGCALLELDSVTSAIDADGTMLRAGACSLSEYVRNEGDNKWALKMNGNCEFLTQGEEMNWDFTTGVEAGSAEDIARRKKEAQGKQEPDAEKPTGDAENEEAVSANEEDFEHFYITIDLPLVSQKHDDGENLGSATSSTKTKSQTPRAKNNIIKSSAQLQFTDLSGASPLVKISNNSAVGSATETSTNGTLNHVMDASELINNRIFETKWHELVGSELIFDDYGELIGQVKEHLTCNPKSKFVSLKPPEPKVKEEKDAEEEGTNRRRKQSAFLKRAIRIAKAREKATIGD